MADKPEKNTAPNEPVWVTKLAGRRPDMVMMAPFMAFLLFLAIQGAVADKLPAAWLPVAIVLKGLAGFGVFWLFRRHFPPFGKPYWILGTVAGVASAAIWIVGEHLFDQVDIGKWNLGGRLFIMPGSPEVKDPRAGISDAVWWSQAIARLSVAVLVVPIVEEIFWRGFLLRALINWDHAEKVPLGKFTWFSFIGTALLSTLQHPDNWLVSILLWMVWNGLMYWKKSLYFLMIVHGVTNLVLYVYVICAQDWRFW